MTNPQRLLGFLVLSGALALALRSVAVRARIPYPVALAIGGMAFGNVVGGAPFAVSADLILLVFVPGLVFQAAFTLDLVYLRRLLAPVGLLATLGVVLTVLGLGALAHVVVGLRWTDAFVLAAILAPTDPIAVVSVLRTIQAPQSVITLLEGESLLNDGTGVAVFVALVASVATGTPSVSDVSGRLLLAVGVGLAVGAACGALGLAVLRATSEATSEFLATLTLAYGAYLGADILHGSGIIAVVSAAVFLASMRGRIQLHGPELLDFWDLTGFVLNALLFLLIGTALPSRDVVASASDIAGVFLALIAVRGLTVPLMLVATDWKARRIPWSARPLVVWGGMRGALSVSLALSVSTVKGVDSRVVTIAYGAVVVGLVIQGVTIRPIARMSGVAHHSSSASGDSS